MRPARRSPAALAVSGAILGASIVAASTLGCASATPSTVASSDPVAHTEFPPAASNAPRAAGSASSAPSVTASSAVEVTLVTFTVVEGTPHTLPDGTTISAGKMSYAHLKGDRNLSRCEVTVTHDGVTETKTLEREGKMTFTVIAGLRIGLDGVNPYQQPSSAFLVVEE